MSSNLKVNTILPSTGDTVAISGIVSATNGATFSGIITGTSFSGTVPSSSLSGALPALDGSALTGVVGSGSGVVVQNSGSAVGTAGTINFGDNLSVSPVSAGIVTITASAGIDTSQVLNVGKLNVTGITTFVGITTYLKRVDFRGGSTSNEVWFWADPSAPSSHMVWRSWVQGGNGGLYLQNSNIYLGKSNAEAKSHIDPGSTNGLVIKQYMDYGDNPLYVRSDFTHIAGSPTGSHFLRKIADFTYQDGCELYYGLPGQNDVKFATSGIGATVFGQLDTTNLTVSGVSTFTGTIDANGDIDVDGHAEFDNVNIAGVVTATTFKGALEATSASFSSNIDANGDLDVDGHTNLDNVSIAGVATVGNLTVSGNSLQASNGTFSNNITANQATFGGNITGPLLSISPGSGNDGIILLNSAGGQNNDFSRIRQDISDDTFKIENKASGSYESLFEGTGNAGVKLFFSGDEKLQTTIKGIQVGTGVTVETNGQATYTGIITALKFIGDGSGLTGVSGSGSGIAVKNSGSVVGTAGTIDFGNGLDVTAISAGIVTVSTATTSITSGNSKVFVNDESTTSNNGSFEVFLSNSTTSGAAHTAFRIYNPSANTNSAEFFHNNTQIYSRLALKATYAGGTDQQIIFRSTNSNYEGSIVHRTGAGEFYFYNTYQGTQYNPLRITTQQIYTQAPINPLADNTYDLGYSVGGTNLRWRQIHATNVSAGVVTATTFHGDGSNLTGISGGGGTNVGITTNLSGSFTASAGSPSTIDTFAYSSGDVVVEYTIYIQNGTSSQTQKLLASRLNTNIDSTQFAVMFTSSLLVQCDAVISGGNILLRATPETGVSGSTVYKVKREVM